VLRSCTIKEDEMSRALSRHGRKEKCIQLLVGKPKEIRAAGRRRRRWDDNIKTDLKKTVWENANRINLA
jgi:hypothetical protein